MTELPRKKELLPALLKIMERENRTMTVTEMNDMVAEFLQIPQELLEIEDANFAGTEYSYRMRWVRTQLKQDGIIENVSRGLWKLK